MLQTKMKLDTFQKLNFRPRPGQLSDNIAQFPSFKNMFVSAMLKVKIVTITWFKTYEKSIASAEIPINQKRTSPYDINVD